MNSEQLKEERKRREMNALAKKSYWVEEGNKLIYPQMKEKWERQVKFFSLSFFWDKEFDTFFDILKILNKEQDDESIAKAAKILDESFQSYEGKGEDYVSMFFLILDFAKRGPEFCKKVVKDLGFSEEDLIAVNDKIEEREELNKIFEEELANAKE